MRPKLNDLPSPGRKVSVRRKFRNQTTPKSVDGEIVTVLGHKGAMVRTSDNGKVDFYRWNDITDVVRIPRRSSPNATLGDAIGTELEKKKAELRVVEPLAIAPEPAKAPPLPKKPAPKPEPVQADRSPAPVPYPFQKPTKPPRAPVIEPAPSPPVAVVQKLSTVPTLTLAEAIAEIEPEYTEADDRAGGALFKKAEPSKPTRKSPPIATRTRYQRVPTQIGSLFKMVRITGGFYQHEFAELLGPDVPNQSAVSLIELGLSLPSDRTLIEFAKLSPATPLEMLIRFRDSALAGGVPIARSAPEVVAETRVPMLPPEPPPAQPPIPPPAPEPPPAPTPAPSPAPAPEASELDGFSEFLLQVAEISPMPKGKDERARWLAAARKMWEARSR
jgi:hypothetical protein